MSMAPASHFVKSAKKLPRCSVTRERLVLLRQIAQSQLPTDAHSPAEDGLEGFCDEAEERAFADAIEPDNRDAFAKVNP